MAWKLYAIEQTQLRRQHRVDGVGRPKFDFRTGSHGGGEGDACWTGDVGKLGATGVVGK